MPFIVPNIDTIKQYLNLLTEQGPSAFRPDCCPTCGKLGLWCHGTYPRKADRLNSGSESLNPIPICRFMCSRCNHTCSSLPECIPPRRWYLWIVQSAAWVLMLIQFSLRRIASILPPARHTFSRWGNRFTLSFKMHVFHLCSRFSDLGASSASMATFWGACLKDMTLSHAMYWIHHAGGKIP